MDDNSTPPAPPPASASASVAAEKTTMAMTMTTNEQEIFNQLLYPDDCYNEHGVYWAELPLAQRIRFVTKCDAKENRRELGNIWKMFKNDPLSPVAYYFRNMVLPGAGLGLEGFVTMSPFFSSLLSLSLTHTPLFLKEEKRFILFNIYL